MAFLQVIVALTVQTAKGFYHFNFPVYFTYLFIVILPRLMEMVLFSNMMHVVINNKFVAHAVGITLWVVVFFLRTTGIFNYNLLLYASVPGFGVSDMDEMVI
ncbi:MAG: hypothetical protein ABIY90_01605 [Puia sp.]